MSATQPPSTNPAGVVMRRPSQYNMIDPRSVKRKPGHNPRFDFGEIAELAKSIRVQAVEHNVPGGLLMPIRVKRVGTEFELIDGDRRLTAIELLMSLAEKGDPEGYAFTEGVAAYSADKDQDDITSLIQMFESNTGKAFLPLEEAAAYKRMQEAGLTIEQIGKKVQRAHTHIVASLALLGADETLKEAVKTKKIGGTIAKKIATAARGDKATQAELTKELLAAGTDTKKRRAVLGKVEQTRVAKAKAKGKVLKMRALTDDQLTEIGTRLAKHLAAIMKEAKMADNMTQAELQDWAAKDDKLAVAYTAGVVDALKVASGLSIKLEL